MSSINLIILGYLHNKEKSAYEMVKEFDIWNLTKWLKISNPSIYKNIIKLCDNGYLNSRTVKEGEMPEKTLYSLNEKGNLYFNELMEESSKHIGNIYLEFNAFLVNIENLPEEKRKEYLKNFKEKAEERRAFVDSVYSNEKQRNERSGSEFLILDLYNEFYSVLQKWSEKVFDYYN
ncbi:PadR family transcriptional regulator [Clostridium saccharobutylicum]|uniref:PadR family transcriptional regulator n=1 Tax=Clostridium saccharobutylicum TaxID=169679 RepID=UPI000400863C|nr:PadR family transcriptional regulator [Clostridium saccharobutylicum]AQR90432.1 transcriptional regulator PadR-like family protein [Clostridium saccharobutylicum]AQS00338.1 transcriptional regulator PadR-like family protein [Clostridium saccharobutylicum]AQS14321.1 transcriptional regulator PadR-like family protein [Clostridium saccharobutylicum]MBA2906602.1 DNA-binding PadR family transcriptional regulator [Clostridium saccharobutylicum]MBA8791210.1 DNA-binding PadR family transcriptional 